MPEGIEKAGAFAVGSAASVAAKTASIGGGSIAATAGAIEGIAWSVWAGIAIAVAGLCLQALQTFLRERRESKESAARLLRESLEADLLRRKLAEEVLHAEPPQGKVA